MGFRNGAYAKVWEVKPNPSGKSTNVRLSVSRKVGDGQYEDDFSGYVSFIATANDRAAGLKKGDRIKLGDVDVSSKYNQDKRERTFSFKVFSFEPADGQQGSAKKPGSSLDAIEDGELPDDFPA
jgi:hypothetical protein